MKLRNKIKSEFYYKQFMRLMDINDKLDERGYPINDKLNKACWSALEKYCDLILKSI